MRRARLFAALFAALVAFAAPHPSGAAPVCDTVDTVAPLKQLLGSGVQTPLLQVSPVCPQPTAPQQPPQTPQTTPTPSTNTQPNSAGSQQPIARAAAPAAPPTPATQAVAFPVRRIPTSGDRAPGPALGTATSARGAGVAASFAAMLLVALAFGLLVGRNRERATRQTSLERMKDEFLANISHELRTPLASAMGFARLMQERDLSPVQTRTFTAAIVEACERLDRVIDLLIDVTALEGGQLANDSDSVDVRLMTIHAADRWQRKAPHHVITARAHLPLPPIGANAGLLRAALDELIDNAIKFSPDGGLITIAPEPEGPDGIVISVADQGIGIPRRKIGRLFEDFQQLDGSATRRFGGLGLGLAFVRRVARAHGGTVTAISEQGRGSTFFLRVPVRKVSGLRKRARRVHAVREPSVEALEESIRP